jgi:hypothetical protein
MAKTIETPNGYNGFNPTLLEEQSRRELAHLIQASTLEPALNRPIEPGKVDSSQQHPHQQSRKCPE